MMTTILQIGSDDMRRTHPNIRDLDISFSDPQPVSMAITGEADHNAEYLVITPPLDGEITAAEVVKKNPRRIRAYSCHRPTGID